MKNRIFTLLVLLCTYHLGLGQNQDHNIEKIVHGIEEKLQAQNDSLYFFRHIIEGLTIAKEADESIGITMEERNRIRVPFKRIMKEHYCLCTNTMSVKDSIDIITERSIDLNHSPSIETIDNCKPVCEQVWSFLQMDNKN